MAPRRERNEAVAGRKRTFEAEALGHLDGLYASALRLTRNPDDAEDLVQDTYVKAFRFAERFEPGTNLKAWLYTILHNTYRNRRRDSARDPVASDSELVEQAEERPADVSTPEQILLRDTLDEELQAAIDSLPEIYREAVWLRDVEEFSYGEIAQMVQVPIGTVMSRIARGRHLLYQRLTAAGAKFQRKAAVSAAAGDGTSSTRSDLRQAPGGPERSRGPASSGSTVSEVEPSTKLRLDVSPPKIHPPGVRAGRADIRENVESGAKVEAS